MQDKFDLISDYRLAGDQPKAVELLLQGLHNQVKNQVLLGVTGSGKTFSMANIIASFKKPSLIIAPNKTLAAQLYVEMKEFFPNNAVEYFVSYYDYYQPEAYIPRSDTYIEKDSAINAQLDLMRHSATRSLMERKDVIIIASVSCIYGIGSPESYLKQALKLSTGLKIDRDKFIGDLVRLRYEQTELEFERGKFRVREGIVDVAPSYLADTGWRLELSGDEIISLTSFDSLTNKTLSKHDEVTLYGNSHYVTPQSTINSAIIQIKEELKDRLRYLYNNNQIIEAHRIKQRTEFDIEMMKETGTCKGIENYSRYLSGRNAGDFPPTLFEYMPKDSLLFVDESHVTIGQISGMYNGNKSRKATLIQHGFRLPSAMDNRPLKFEEWDMLRPQTIFISATPGKYELGITEGKYVEQVMRPTGLIDPICEIRPAEHQVDDLINEIHKVIAKKQRILVTTLTKKMAEKLTEYLCEAGVKVSYIHSDIRTIERVEILRNLRKGDVDVVVGVNLLREGIDVPECSLVAILNADKEGFLRSETSLIQTIGRAARNLEGRAILYADKITRSMHAAIFETNRRRNLQVSYNEEHGITPAAIKKALSKSLVESNNKEEDLLHLNADQLKDNKHIEKELRKLKKQMLKHAKDLEFEKATHVRNEIHRLEELLLVLQ